MVEVVPMAGVQQQQVPSLRVQRHHREIVCREVVYIGSMGGGVCPPDHARRGWSAVSSYQGHRSGLSGPDRYGGVFGPCTTITTQ